MDSLITLSGWLVSTCLAITGYIYYIKQLSHRAMKHSNDEHILARQTFYKFKADHFQTTLNACPDAVFITNDHGIITYVNPTSTNMFGLSPEDLLGQNVTVLMPESIARFHHQYLIDFHLTGKTGTIGRRREIKCKHKDGSLFPAELSLGATKEGGKYLFIGIITDISERKAVEAKHKKSEQLREILTNSTDCIMLLFTPDGFCKQANHAALKSLNKREDEVIGCHISDFTDTGIANDRLKCMSLAESCMESFVVYDERDNRTFENTYTPIMDEHGFVSEVAVHANDITQRLEYESSLKNAKKAAEDANESKTLFISKVSHELKNPLHAILGFAQILNETLSEQIQGTQHVERTHVANSTSSINNRQPTTGQVQQWEEQKQAIDTIISSGSHILDLINDLLDISSAELDLLPVTLNQVNAVSLIQDITHMMSPVAKASEITLHIDHETPEQWVQADTQRLKQVITNLISNAIKYSHRESEISIRSYKSTPHTLAISVKDKGIGIPVNEQSNLFKVFTRASNGTQVSGNGLGLHLCKQLMNQMNGRIHFESKEHQGSRFWIELPITHQTPPPNNTVSINKNKASKKEIETTSASAQVRPFKPELKLLVVEDNPSNVRLIEKVVQRIEGYAFFHASTCEAANALLQEQQPTVLILDINLPDGDGLSLLNQDHHPDHTIVLSAFLNHDQIELPKQGIDLVLTKPVNIKQLTESLTYWRDLHQTQNQNKEPGAVSKH